MSIHSFDDESPIDKNTAEVINYIFYRLKGILPSMKYSVDSLSGLDSIRKEYTYEIRKNNITQIERINRAIDRIRADGFKFIPVPAEFVAYCKALPKDIGAPALDAAYREAIRNAYPDGTEKKWTHPAVRNAAHRSDMYFLRTGSANETLKRFTEHYQNACGDYADGKNMNQIESQAEDNQVNRQKYQEYYGGCMLMRNYSKTPADITVLSYNEWLAKDK